MWVVPFTSVTSGCLWTGTGCAWRSLRKWKQPQPWQPQTQTQSAVQAHWPQTQAFIPLVRVCVKSRYHLSSSWWFCYFDNQLKCILLIILTEKIGCGQKISLFKVEILIVNWNFVYAQHTQKGRHNYFWKALPLPLWLRLRVRRCKGRRCVTYSGTAAAVATVSGWPVTMTKRPPPSAPSCPPSSIQTTPSVAAKVSWISISL